MADPDIAAPESDRKPTYPDYEPSPFTGEDVAHLLKAIKRLDARGRERLWSLHRDLEAFKPGEVIAIRRYDPEAARARLEAHRKTREEERQARGAAQRPTSPTTTAPAERGAKRKARP